MMVPGAASETGSENVRSIAGQFVMKAASWVESLLVVSKCLRAHVHEDKLELHNSDEMKPCLLGLYSFLSPSSCLSFACIQDGEE